MIHNCDFTCFNPKRRPPLVKLPFIYTLPEAELGILTPEKNVIIL